ncbi:MAG: NUDIX domain-containing protein [Patescibacteria group bacterium]|nr:NUDIX domain-containing protein [Patescibacteria group bacterium]
MKKSSGLLVWREKQGQVEILLVHHGGPFWQNRDKNAWSIPKGEIEEGEDIKETAIREFNEETGLKLNSSDVKKLKYLGKIFGYNKMAHIFILKKDFGDKIIPYSLPIKMKVGRRILYFPEIDRIAYFDLDNAREKLVIYQKKIIDLFKNYLEKTNKSHENHQKQN